MIYQKIDIEGYWKVIVVYDAYLGYYNVGFTHTNYKKRLSIVGISPTITCEEFENTLIHELRHLVDDICVYYGVKLNSEKAAYLSGYLIKRMYRFYREYINC